MIKSGATVEQIHHAVPKNPTRYDVHVWNWNLAVRNVPVVVIAWMGKVERSIPLKINLIPAVAAAEVNQSLYQNAQIRLEITNLDIPA